MHLHSPFFANLSSKIKCKLGHQRERERKRTRKCSIALNGMARISTNRQNGLLSTRLGGGNGSESSSSVHAHQHPILTEQLQTIYRVLGVSIQIKCQSISHHSQINVCAAFAAFAAITDTNKIRLISPNF